MSTSEPPSEEELRAAYEAEIKRLRVEQILLESIVSLVNLGMRRSGLAPGTEDEREPEQVELAIDSVRALMPIIERIAPEQAKPIRDALSQLQLAYLKIGGRPAGAGAGGGAGGASGSSGGSGGAGSGGEGDPGPTPPPDGPDAPPAPAGEPVKPGEPGPAQRSGRLWVPGQ